MTRRALQVLLLSVAFAVGTIAVGWLAVPGLALVWGALRRHQERPASIAMLGAGLGWAWLLIWNAAVRGGEVSELVTRTAGVFALPRAGFVALTLAFPMVLAWGAAATAGALRRRGKRVSVARDSGESSVRPSGQRRAMLAGEIEVGGRTWRVKEEIRQGLRPQIFILTAADTDTSEMHIRPMPGVELTTLEEVASAGADPLTRSFVDRDGVRWEARMVVSSGELGDVELIKIYSYRTADVFEEAYPFPDGLGLRTDDELLQLLDNAEGQSGRG